MMMTKGKMIQVLKSLGVRKSEAGKKLESCRTFEIINLFYKVVEPLKEDDLIEFV